MRSRPTIVGVIGGSGSGKTTVVNALLDRNAELGAVCVSQDDYYKPAEMQSKDDNGELNFDLPSALDLRSLARDLLLLKAGVPVARREYTFNQSGRIGRLKKVPPAPMILVEGLFLLEDRLLSSCLDVKVYLEVDEDIQLQRRMERDASERGYGEGPVRYQWENHVLPAYHRFVVPHKHRCDLVLRNEGPLDDVILRIQRTLMTMKKADQQEAT